MAHGESARLPANEMQTRPVTRYHAPAASMGRGKKSARGEDAEAENDLQQPRQHPRRARNKTHDGESEQCAGGDRRQKLLDGHEDHLVGQSGMYAVRAPAFVRRSMRRKRLPSKSRWPDMRARGLRDRAARALAPRLPPLRRGQSRQAWPGRSRETPYCAPPACECC